MLISSTAQCEQCTRVLLNYDHNAHSYFSPTVSKSDVFTSQMLNTGIKTWVLHEIKVGS